MANKASLIKTCAALILLSSAGHAQDAESQSEGFADPILGRWDLTVEGENGGYPSWLDIRLRTEQQLMAQFVGQFGSARYASVVSFTNDVLELHAPVQYEPGPDDLVFTGSVDGGVLTGKVRMGDGTTLEWRGVRAPSLDREAAIRWGKPVALIGADLDGWHPRDGRYPGCWSVSGGILKVTPPCVDIVSDAQFDDFRLQLEFRYPPGSNSGVYLRGRYEVQIQDDYGKAPDPLRMGGIYGFKAPVTDALGKPNEWQTYDIELIGRRVSVTLNGKNVISGFEIPGITGGALDSDEGSSGPLMLQGDHGPIEFRNVIITPGA
jgi:hypothetical protein